MASNFDTGSFFVRLLFAAALVFSTYNPTAFSYVSWVMDEDTRLGPIVALLGIALLIGWVIFARATFRSLGWFGIVLGVALFACFTWLFLDMGWVSMDSPGTLSWIGLVILSLILATGMSWSHIRRRMSGQLDVDDVED